ncbi:DUF1830 domain-containing protein [Leptolyngbya sp. FACHB-16]|nr:DUF1830 domain-containing protein [Leptolyngbya sp. FACHB-16]
MAEAKLVYYKNITTLLQTIHLFHGNHQYFEKVVFPGECLILEALPDSELEIAINVASGMVLRDRFPCNQLQEIEPTR